MHPGEDLNAEALPSLGSLGSLVLGTTGPEGVVSDWLAGLQLPEYAELFSKSGFRDMEDVRAIHEDDLVEMGVLRVHRRRILNALNRRSSSQHSTQPTSPRDELDADSDTEPNEETQELESIGEGEMEGDARGRLSPEVTAMVEDLACGTMSVEQVRRKYPSARSWDSLLKAAKAMAEEPRFQDVLGVCHLHGFGGLRCDPKAAVELFKEAAEQGYANAQMNLGCCFETGRGVQGEDYSLAMEWYEKAAEQGHAAAQYNFGACLGNGQVQAANLEKAAFWFSKAAAQGDVDAQSMLGTLLISGRGIARDSARAVKLFEAAAKGGDALAMYNLAACTEVGEGVDRADTEAALEWYRQAAAHGSARAHDALSRLGRTAAPTAIFAPTL